jgi:hypothetical protein
MTAEELLARAWSEHGWDMAGPTTCKCGWNDDDGADDWFALLAAHVAAAQVAALREAGLLPEVEIVKERGGPATCRVRVKGSLVFDGVSRDALPREAR